MVVPEVTKNEKQLKLETITWGNLTWLNIEQPTERETKYLAQCFPFHPLNLDDVLSRIQRPKIDEYEDHFFIVLHFPVLSAETQVITSSELDIFIGKGYLVTIDCSGNLKPPAKFFKLCQTDAEAQQENLSHGAGYLVYRLVDRLVDYCFPMVNKITDDIEKVEDNIFNDSARGTVKELSTLRREIISLRRIIWPIRAVIASLEPKIRRFTDMDLTNYFGDTIDHLDKIWDALDEYKEIIEGLNDTYNSLATNRTNETMRTLTLIGTILMPILVLSSIYGMNIPLPFQETSLSLTLVILISTALTVGMYYFLRRRGWF